MANKLCISIMCVFLEGKIVKCAFLDHFEVKGQGDVGQDNERNTVDARRSSI